jgi:hypothetical protein
MNIVPQDRPPTAGELIAEPLRWQDSHDAQLLSRSYDVALLDEEQAEPSTPALPPRVVGVLVRWAEGSRPAYTLTAARHACGDTRHRLAELALGLLLGGEGAPRADWLPYDADGEHVEVVFVSKELGRG